MKRRPPRSTQSRSSAASDVYKRQVYARFRDRIESNFNTPDQLELEIKNLKRFAEYYDRFLRPEHEKDDDIQKKLVRLNVLELSTGYPFLLALFDAYNAVSYTHLRAPRPY